MHHARRAAPLLVVLALMSLACGTTASPSGTSTGTPGPSIDPTTFALQVASLDIAAGEPARIQVGIVQADQTLGIQLLTAGTVDLTLRPYQGGSGTEVIGRAVYVPAPGTAGDATGTPTLTAPDVARGVYELDTTLDVPGVWEAEAGFTLDGTPVTLIAQFQVLEEHTLPAPGDRALRTENLTVRTADDLQALDSRAQDGADLPDPELHADTIAGAIAEGRPALVLFATPVYCQSQFCGPTTDALQELAAEGPEDVAFIHVEIWADHGASQINRAAADWLLRDGDLTEPWLFLIGADGRIADRWGPLFDVAEVRAALDAL